MASFKTIAGGVQMSKGRGADKTLVTISTKEIETWARRNRAEMPRLVRRAHGSAASALQKQLRRVMKVGGGVHGVPSLAPLETFTRYVRHRTGTANLPIGRRLAEPKRIVKYKHGKDQIIGWPDTLGEVACKFQDGEGHTPDKFASNAFRYAVAKDYGISVASVPTEYVHKNRDVVKTFARHAAENLKPWAKTILDKEIAKQLAKERGIA